MNTQTETIEVGSLLKFTGYTNAEQTPILAKGDIVRVTEILPDDEGISAKVIKTTDEKVGDTVFYPEEAEMYVVEAAAQEAPRARSRGKGGKGGKGGAAAAGGNTEEQKAAKAAEKAAAKAAKEQAKAEKAAAKAAEKAKREAERAAAEVPVETPVSETLAATLHASGDDPVSAAISLRHQIEQSFIVMGGVLSRIYHEKLYIGAGYKDFGSFVSEKLDIQYRKAMYLIAIYLWSQKVGVDEDALAEIGWSKALYLTALATTKAKAKRALTYAKTHSKDEVDQWVRTTFGSDEDPQTAAQAPSTRVEKTSFKFTLRGDVAKTARVALEQAKKLEGVADDSAAFAHIVSDWAMQSEAAEEVPLEDAIAVLNARYGVKLAEVVED